MVYIFLNVCKGYRKYGWGLEYLVGKPGESSIEKMTYDLKKVKWSESEISGRENSKCKGLEEGAC